MGLTIHQEPVLVVTIVFVAIQLAIHQEPVLVVTVCHHPGELHLYGDATTHEHFITRKNHAIRP